MMMVDEKYKHYLTDVGLYIRERAEQAKAARDRLKADKKPREFEDGRLLALNEVISIMQQHAKGFAIPLDEISLYDLDPERDLR